MIDLLVLEFATPVAAILGIFGSIMRAVFGNGDDESSDTQNNQAETNSQDRIQVGNTKVDMTQRGENDTAIQSKEEFEWAGDEEDEDEDDDEDPTPMGPVPDEDDDRGGQSWRK